MVTTRIFLSFAFLIWLSSSITGMAVLWNHEARPGLSAVSPPQWPSDSQLVPGDARSTLLVWLHPHCPCSWASVGELERLLAQLQETVECQVLLSLPPESCEEFAETDLARAVRRLPGVRVVIDHEQREAIRFGVATSGQVLLYGENSTLLFAGGITPGRGHQGDSVGATTLREVLSIGTPTTKSLDCSVFGCSLMSGFESRVQAP